MPSLETVHKRRPQSGGRGLSSADTLVLQMRTSALFGAKILKFWNYGVFAVQADKRGGGINFTWFCANVFYGRPRLQCVDC